MIDATSFSKLVPGFEFLENMMRGAGQATPGMGQWVAPTLDPAELEKRIGELKTVQFWLEQNGRMIGATIQAMEVQRMTLSTLQTMNLPLADLQRAMLLPTAPAPATPAAAAPVDAAAPTLAPTGSEAARGKAGVVDPMQWWSALTQQFGELAAKAVQDSSASISTLAAVLPKSAQSDAKDGAGAAAKPSRKTAAKPAARKVR